MEDIEIHIKRRHNSNQTLCMEADGAAMDPIHLLHAITFVEIVLPTLGSFPSQIITRCNCLRCITEVQKTLLAIVAEGSNRIAALHETSLAAIDEHFSKLRDTFGKTAELADDTTQTAKQIIKDLKEGV